MRRIAVTGVGAVTPLGVGADTLHARWAQGDCGIRDGLATCDDFDPSGVLSRKEQRRSDRFSQFSVVAADEALAQASWLGDLPYEPERIACFVGTGIGGIRTFEQELRGAHDGGEVSALTIPLLMPNAGAAAVGMHFGFKGESAAIVTACAAGAQAIGAGVKSIRSGVADAALVGGAEAAQTEVIQAAFAAMGATSKLGVSRPFDRRRDGFVTGEGAGALVLEDLGAARARGATVMAEIVGYGATSDSFHVTAPEPSGEMPARSIALAMEDAGVGPSDIAYVNAHGTSTSLNDKSETRALKVALGPEAYRIPTSSTKSTIGHLLGAAGAVEAVATVQALRAAVAPPTLGLEEPDPDCDLDYVPDEARRLERRSRDGRLVALTSSFGFGGHNAVIAIATDPDGA